MKFPVGKSCCSIFGTQTPSRPPPFRYTPPHDVVLDVVDVHVNVAVDVMWTRVDVDVDQDARAFSVHARHVAVSPAPFVQAFNDIHGTVYPAISLCGICTVHVGLEKVLPPVKLVEPSSLTKVSLVNPCNVRPGACVEGVQFKADTVIEGDAYVWVSCWLCTVSVLPAVRYCRCRI